jgi:hypothetical protein
MSGRDKRNLNRKGKMKLEIKHIIALAAASSLALASSAIAAPHGAGNGMSPGNSSFGHSQGGNPVTGATNSTYGRNNAAEARLNSSRDSDDLTENDNDNGKIKKTKRVKNHTARGNSAFGHRQGDAATRTRGSQNNAFGKTRSASAKAKLHKPDND